MSFKICRICCRSEGVYYLFQKEDSDLQISAKIMYCCSKINIEEGDGLPSKVCEGCKAELEVAYQFVIKCESADRNIRSLEILENEIKFEVKPEVEDSDLDRDDQVSLINYEFEAEIPKEKPLTPVKKSENIKPYAKKSKKPRVKKIKQIKEHTCLFCDYKTNSKKDSMSHLDKHLLKGSFDCPKCDRKYKSKGSLISHIRTRHDVNRVRKYICDTCGKACYTKNCLKVHIRTHTRETPYSCPLCPKKFTQSSALINHKELHEGVRKYRCPLCSKCFVTGNSLRRHKQTHKSEKKYKCPICPKLFISRKNVTIHTRLHTEHKDCICDHCGKTLSYNNLSMHIRRRHSKKSGFCQLCAKDVPNLEDHMNVHAGVKKFKCDLCDESYFRATSLANHKTFRHTKYKFKCEECGKSFPKQYNLDIHIARHHKPGFTFPCDWCSRGFYRSCDLTKHKRGTHKIGLQ